MSRAGSRAALAALLAICAALLLGACGGDDSTTTSAQALSDEQYSAELQEIATLFAGGFDELSEQAANPSSLEDFKDAVVGIQARISETVDALEALTPPEDLSDDHEQLVQAFVDYRDGYDPIVEAVDAGDQQALKEAAAQIPTVVENFQTSYNEVKARMAEAGVTIEGDAESDADTTTTPAG